MHRRDFMKSVGAAPLAAAAPPAERVEAPGFRARGRRQVLDLSGPWRLRMDEANAGLAARWFEREPAGAGTIAISVPSVWQQYVDMQGGIGWYFKEFDLPRELASGMLRLRFGAVDYRAHAWLNGRELGMHEGGFTPFEFDIRPAARAGRNRLVVRVADVGRDFRRPYCGLPGWDRPGRDRVDGLSFAEIPAGFQDWREGFNHCGIWQPVEVIAHALLYVSDIFVVPRVSGAAEVRLELTNESGKPVEVRAEVEIKAWKGGGAAGGNQVSLRLEPGVHTATVPVEIRQPHLWSPDDPFLYVAEVRLSEGGQLSDDRPARFGVRELTVGSNGWFELNGKRIFLKGAHYQSTEPLTLAFPHSTEMARRIVEVAREGGFNFMRYQGRPTAPSILDAADEIGILVQSEPAVSKMADNRRMEELALRETRELIRRDRNRPSIAIWNMINEQAAGMRVVHKMCLLARELDPTRLITESAGGPSHFYRPYSPEGVSYLTEHSYQRAPVSEGVRRYWSARGLPGQLYFVTEFGYGGLEDIDAVIEKWGPRPTAHMEDYHGFIEQKRQVERAFEDTGASKLFSGMAAFREASQSVQANAVKMTVESLRANPRAGGFNIVQLFDSNGNEVDGLVDFWRNNKKKAFHALRELNQPLVLIVQFSPLNPRTGQDLEVAVTLVNEDRISGSKTLHLRATGPSGRELFARTGSVDAQPWSTRLFEGRIPMGSDAGAVKIEAELRDGSQVVIARTEQLRVYDPRQCPWPERAFSIFDPQDRWPSGRRPAAARTEPYRPGGGRARLVVAPEFTALWRQPAQFRQFVELVDEVRRGSTLLFLGIPSDGPPPMNHRGLGTHSNFSALTIPATIGFSLGTSDEPDAWGSCVGPYGWAAGNSRAGSPVTRHAVFEGLPGPGLMDWEYGNVISPRILAASRMPIEDTGPGIQIFPLESGRVACCTYLLMENAETDALAERMLANLVGYLDRQLPAELRPPSDREEEALRFKQQQIQDCYDKFLSGELRA